jgi:tetratricopeptide (TPR) repeat protein
MTDYDSARYPGDSLLSVTDCNERIASLHCKSHGLHMKAGPKKRCRVSRLEWDEVRSTITDLYIRQGLPLKKVISKMQSDGFSASEQMYKKQFRLWSERKYYSEEQKAQVVDQLSKIDDDRAANEIIVNKQPLKVQRIERYLRQQYSSKSKMTRERPRTASIASKDNPTTNGHNEPLSDERWTTSSNASSAPDREKLRESELQASSLTIHRPEDHVNSILHNVQNFYTGFFIWDKAVHPFGFCKELADVFNVASAARRAQHANELSRRAYLVQSAMSSIGALLRCQPLQLIQEIPRRFTRPEWMTAPSIRAFILRCLYFEASRLYATDHPLPVVLELLQDPTIIDQAASPIFKLVSELVAQKLRRGSEDVFALQQDLAEALSGIGDHRHAEIICQSSIVQAESIFPEHHWVNRNIKRDLGLVRYREGDWDEAERLWKEVFELTFRDQGAHNIGATGRLTCEYLGTLYEKRARERDLEAAATYYKLALDGAVAAWGPNNVDVLEYFDNLARVLGKAGDFDGTVSLYKEYQALAEQREQSGTGGSKL